MGIRYDSDLDISPILDLIILVYPQIKLMWLTPPSSKQRMGLADGKMQEICVRSGLPGMAQRRKVPWALNL